MTNGEFVAHITAMLEYVDEDVVTEADGDVRDALEVVKRYVLEEWGFPDTDLVPWEDPRYLDWRKSLDP